MSRWINMFSFLYHEAFFLTCCPPKGLYAVTTCPMNIEVGTMTAPHAIGAVTSLVTSCCPAGNLEGVKWRTEVKRGVLIRRTNHWQENKWATRALFQMGGQDCKRAALFGMLTICQCLIVVSLPDLPVLRERGHSCALLRVALRQAGADLQHVGLPWLGNHHGVVQRSRYSALSLWLSLGRLLGLTLRLQCGREQRHEFLWNNRGPWLRPYSHYYTYTSYKILYKLNCAGKK